uniref:Protein kinase domain-containing protein n=1 Tax=Alexandrium monilatum TaxID=311494 RepID=A0A7S4PWY8_9DINO
MVQQPPSLHRSGSVPALLQQQTSPASRRMSVAEVTKTHTLQMVAHESLVTRPLTPQSVLSRKPTSPQASSTASTRTPQSSMSPVSPSLFRRTGSSSLSTGTLPPATRESSSTAPSPSNSGSSSSPVHSSSLLSRRLNRRTGESGGPTSKTGQPLRLDTKDQGGRRRIKRCENFTELYRIGGEVMPSVHRDMEIRWGVSRNAEREEVVIKIRHKRGSFHSSSDESSWRASTEMMLNLPQCSGIARIHDVFEDKDAYYVVMEKVGGMDLFETLQAEGKLPVEEVKEILRQLLEAVSELHESGCIHKDLKLENVMFSRRGFFVQQPLHSTTPTGGGAVASRQRRASAPQAAAPSSVKLIDFDTVEEWTPKSPKAADVLGTDQYIAPEAYEGRYSPASDIFAVGVIGYRLLTGNFPFRAHIFDDQPGENWVGSPKMKEIKDRLHSERIDWRHPIFNAERGLQHLIARMLAAKETLRPSAREVLNDPSLAPTGPRSPARNRFSGS